MGTFIKKGKFTYIRRSKFLCKMSQTDTFLTVLSPSQGLYKEKGSKFISYLFHVETEEEAKEYLVKIKKEHHDARHHCYAYSLGEKGENWRVNDDGEPSGTGGRPILGQIRSRGVTNVLIIVVRYFGGTLLGVSGLANAYKMAAEDALTNAMVTEHIIHENYEIEFPFASLNSVMKILKDENIKQSDHRFDLVCNMKISLRKSASPQILHRFSLIEGFKSSLISVY